MNKRIFEADLLLLLTAAIWGFGFVAQRSGMQYIGPFAFNGLRFILASLSLLPLIFWRSRRKREADIGQTENRQSKRKILLFSSFLAGSCLFVAVSFQQLGMMVTSAGNGGFITGFYVIFTPIFGIFLGRKTGKATWAGAVFMLAGLYFISSSGPLKSINPGDVFVAIGAVFWSFHVLIIDRLVQKNDPIELSSGQFAFGGLYALGAAFLLEPLLSEWVKNLNPEILSMGYFDWKSFPDLVSGLA